jgi:uncharacterized protein
MEQKLYDTLIDCDIHQRIKSPKDLYPYLAEQWRRDIDMFGLRVTTTGSGGFLNGGAGGYRADSWPEDGTMAGSDLPLMQEQLLDFYDIEYGLLLGQDLSPISGLPDADYAAALASAYNDWMIENWVEKDSRLKGLALIAFQDIDQAVAEIERVASHPGIVGVIASNPVPLPFGNRYYHRIFELCNDLNLPFTMHAGGLDRFVNCSYYIEKRQERPMMAQAIIASMVFEGLFEKFPNLQIVFTEMNYLWLPAFLWKLDSDWRGLRDQTPWVQKPPSEYVYEHCKFVSQPIETTDKPSQLLTMFEWAKAEKTLMFSTDYPHWDFDSPIQALPLGRMPEEMRRNVMSETARDVYNLPARKEAEAAVAD